MVDRGHIVSSYQQYYWRPMGLHKRIGCNEEATIWLAPKRDYARFDLGVAMNWRCDRVHVERSSSCLERGQKVCPPSWRRVGIKHVYGPLDAGRNLLEQLQPFASHFFFCEDETGKTPARAG